MSLLMERLTSQENLTWAWLKAKRKHEVSDVLSDDLEVAEFEIDVMQSLTSIGSDLKRGVYRLQPLIPVAHPKSPDEFSSPRIRQAFKVAIRDQVAWIALINIIGPGIENKMPTWSYGNRLYRQMLYKEIPDGKVLQFGHFRHAKGALYRPFSQAWPRFRRDVLFTARKMTGDKIILDERDDEFLEIELRAKRLPYLVDNWWKEEYAEAYWATVDFRDFYPKINLDLVRTNLYRFSDYLEEKDELERVVEQLIRFPLGHCDWANDAMDLVGLQRNQSHLTGIPTGLFVDGFLANTAMLELDKWASRRLKNRQIAQFRYVDDHTFLAPTWEKLEAWLDEYLAMVGKSSLGATINEDKTEPKGLRKYRSERQADDAETSEYLLKAIDATRIDIRVPAPLLTKTLAKVSMLAQTEIDLQTFDEQDSFLADVEQLLLTEFPPEELRPETRMSFAMSQLCRVTPVRFLHSREILEAETEVAEFIEAYHGAPRPESTKIRKLLNTRDKVITEQFSRTFKHILITLERCSDRPRLWTQAVRFCLRTGYSPGLRDLVKMLQQEKCLHPQSVKYMLGFILQRINRYFLQALEITTSPEHPLSQRSAAVRFANACYVIGDALQLSRCENFHTLETHRECQRAFELLSQCVRSRQRGIFWLDETHLFLHQQGLLRSLPSARDARAPQAPTTRQETAVAAWFVDTTITPFAARHPSFYWKKIAPHLSPSWRTDAAVLSRWPGFLPARARSYFLGRSETSALGRRGWISSLSPAPGPAHDSMSLDQWISYLLDTQSPWSPKRSEWTALEIVRQALSGYFSFAERNRNLAPMVPQNILIPLSWALAPASQSPLTWEKWQKITREGTVQLRDDDIIHDDRYSPRLWYEAENPRESWEDVYSSGLILLGLLRLTFDLPCNWNPEGQIRLWSWGATRMISSIPCSSWTLAILQSTVLPRNRETFFLRDLDQFQYRVHDDTIDDPPEINNPEELDKRLRQAQQILEKHRVTVQDHKPRQLIPLSLDQIGRVLFESIEGGAEL